MGIGREDLLKVLCLLFFAHSSSLTLFVFDWVSSQFSIRQSIIQLTQTQGFFSRDPTIVPQSEPPNLDRDEKSIVAGSKTARFTRQRGSYKKRALLRVTDCTDSS